MVILNRLSNKHTRMNQLKIKIIISKNINLWYYLQARKYMCKINICVCAYVYACVHTCVYVYVYVYAYSLYKQIFLNLKNVSSKKLRNYMWHFKICYKIHN